MRQADSDVENIRLGVVGARGADSFAEIIFEFGGRFLRGIDGGDFFSQRLILRVEVFGVEIGGGVEQFVRHYAAECNVGNAIFSVAENAVELRLGFAAFVLEFFALIFQVADSALKVINFTFQIVNLFVLREFFVSGVKLGGQARNFRIKISGTFFNYSVKSSSNLSFGFSS